MPLILLCAKRRRRRITLSLATLWWFISLLPYFLFSSQAAEQITDVEREAFKKAFDEFDVNKDGHITSSELKTVLKKLGQNPTDQEIAEFIKVCDVDKNGTIEFGEFCRYLVSLRRKVRATVVAKYSTQG